MTGRALPAIVALACAVPAVAAADSHIYAYEAVSPATRTLAPTGLSFQFEKRAFGGVRVERILQTGERGAADLEPADQDDLGAGGLQAALGGARPAGRLYQIAAGQDGRAFVRAVCPGAERAWLLIGPFERFGDLKVQAVGRAAGEPAARHCVDLELRYRSELALPPRRPPPPGQPRIRR